MTWVQAVEISAVVFGLVCVVLTIKQHIWCWPTGLVNVVLFAIVFYQAKLYSDLLLQLIYVVLQVYGWWNWLHGGKDRTGLKVSRLTPAGAGFWAATTLTGAAGLGYAMSAYTDADLPYLDSTTTVLSLVAQWLMTKKVLESWHLWITVDVLYLGVYNYKALYPTMGMYAVFLMLAVSGLWQWKKSLPAPA